MNGITLEPGKRGGSPCVHGLRILVYDVLSMLPCGMSQQEVQDEFMELTSEGVLAVLAYAADRVHQVVLPSTQYSACLTKTNRSAWYFFLQHGGPKSSHVMMLGKELPLAWG